MGEKQDGRPILEQGRTGDNFLVFFREKHWENSLKNLDGRQKIVVGGRARPKYRPSFYTGGGVDKTKKKFCQCQNRSFKP